MPEVRNKLTEVFGTSRDVPLSYVERKNVDDRFLNDIVRDKHIVVHGASKQGKTSLRKHHLKDEDYIVIQSTRDSTRAAIYEMILKHAGVKCEVSESVTLSGSKKISAKVCGEGKVPFVAKLSGEVGFEGEKGTEGTKENSDFEIDPSDANDVIRVLHAARFKKFIVIEDFHYLDEIVQQELAFDLKVFHESSKLVFIVVGVWLEANRLTIYNGDLTGRIATINADVWAPNQLREVLEVGESLLNIGFPEAVKESLVSGAQGNVGLFQEVCFRLCEKYEIWTTQEVRLEIGSNQDVIELLHAVAEEQAARYRNFLARFAEGLGHTQYEMYKWIGYAVATATLLELRSGMRANVLFNRIKEKHPSGVSLQQNNVVQALDRIGTVQYKHKLQPLIFDMKNGALVVVDANFLIFKSTHSDSQLLEYLGFIDQESEA